MQNETVYGDGLVSMIKATVTALALTCMSRPRFPTLVSPAGDRDWSRVCASQ